MPKRQALPKDRTDRADESLSEEKPADLKPSPMMAQYLDIKAAHGDCLLFYRMGDFYELFFEDAEKASAALNIVLTKRGKHKGDDIPMCGVPVERADDYLQRLIAKGHRVAVCEQVEDPAEAKKRGGKSVVARAVVRLVTPGTITEERLLDPGRSNCLLAVSMKEDAGFCRYGLAALDISTGAFHVLETPEVSLGAEIARIDPCEIVAAEALCARPFFARLLSDMKASVTPLGRDLGDAETATRRLKDFFHLVTLDGLGAFADTELLAAATAVFYVERTQLEARPALDLPARLTRATRVEIDAATRANLELTRTLSGTREGSLLDVIDCTVTSAGSRLLAERLASPLTDPSAIEQRLDALGFFASDDSLLKAVRSALKSVPDLVRALSRLALGRGGPRDLACLRDGLITAAELAETLLGFGTLPEELLQAARDCAAIDPALAQALADALAEELPLQRRDGNFIRAGYSDALDDLRALRDESRRVIAALQAHYAELAQIKNLKLKHNHFLGYFVEVPQAQGEALLKAPLNETFIHRQTMADAMRFSTSELATLESKISSAGDEALAIESRIFDALLEKVLAEETAIKALAMGLARLDVASSLAALAIERHWVRPIVDATQTFIIEGGRHPVVEKALKAAGQPFVANDCDLSGAKEGGAIAVITGPNMAGKSTYLRQNALIAVLAQMGSFVPATRAHIGVIDRLFSRVGAADDLARGRSTFMVEMVETAAILNQATRQSLVILDEIGRGTATFDGLSIAWAVVEHLHEKNRARAIFATHFHELTHLAKRLNRLVNLTMRVTDWAGDLVFLHEIIAGAADRSYGIQVAKLAGLPPSVVERAKGLLAELEAGDRRQPVEKLVADLPLFALKEEPAPPLEPMPPKDDKLAEALNALDPDALTPREALEALYRLKEAAKKSP